METVKIDMFQEEVYVFTPRGEVRTFPCGATPVDFAYGAYGYWASMRWRQGERAHRAAAVPAA